MGIQFFFLFHYLVPNVPANRLRDNSEGGVFKKCFEGRLLNKKINKISYNQNQKDGIQNQKRFQ